MRVLHVTSDWKWTGPAEPMLHAVTGLRERGHACDLACPAEPAGLDAALLTRARERGVEPVALLRVAQGYRPWRERAEIQRLRASIVEGGYQLVHAHHTRDLLLCRAALRGSEGRLAGVQLVVSWHRGEPISRTPWNRWLWGPRRLAGIAVLSSSLAQRTAEDLAWPRERIVVLPGVVDAEKFTPRTPPRELRSELGLEPGQRVLGIVARLQPHRRFELLLEAVARVRREHPELRVLVVGRGTRARQVLDEPVERLGLGDVVIRAGYRRGDYLDVLACMDGLAFLVPGSDGSCRAVLEGMSMQLPILATRRGVLPDTIGDGIHGKLFDETPTALAQVLRDFCREPEVWAARGHAARERVLSVHRIEQYAQRLEAFYTRLLRA